MSEENNLQSFEHLFFRKKPAMASVVFWEKTVEWTFVRKYYSHAFIAAPLGGNAELAADAVLDFLDDGRLCLIEFKRRDLDFKSECEKYPIYGADKWKGLKEDRRKSYEHAFRALIDLYGASGKAPHLFVYGVLNEVTFLDAVDRVGGRAGKALLAGNVSGVLGALFGAMPGKVAQKRKTLALDVEGKPYWGEWANKEGLPKIGSDAGTVQLSALHGVGWKFKEFTEYVESLVAAKGSRPNDDDPPGHDWNHSMVMAVSSDGSSLAFSVFEFIRYFMQSSKAVQESEKEMHAGRGK